MIKKATISITVISILIFMGTYLMMQLNLKKRAEYEQLNIDFIAKSVKGDEGLEFLEEDDNLVKYQYAHFEIQQETYTSIGPCLQQFMVNSDFNSTNCTDKLLDVFLNKYGESELLLAVLSDMLIYTKAEVIFSQTYLWHLLAESKQKGFLKAKLIVRFLNRFRDPEALEAMYKRHKATVLDFVPKQAYDKLFKLSINKLIESYNTIQSKPDKDAFFKDLYFKAETYGKHYEYWFYTFWKRRELEGNNIIIFNILKDIDNHFSKQ